MMPSGSISPLASLSTPSSSGRLYRVSKACENCRVRRIKCQPPYPCEGCRSAHLTDCHVRDRARPNRSTRQAGSSQTVRGTSHQQRIRPIQNIDDQLARLYADKTGVSIDLTIAQGHTHPLLDTDTPLPPLPDITPRAPLAIQAFVIHCLPTCSFLTPARINHLFERYVASPTSLGPDQLALIYACLACGYVRLEYFGGHERNATSVPQEQREDVPWYRHAVHTLTAWGSTTFTSLHALSVLWFYTTLVSTTASRFVVSWLVSQARELGLHHEQTAMAVPQVPSDQAAFMLYIILYAHGHTISLSDFPPVIKVGEFDTMIFKIQTPQEETVPAGLYPSPAIYDLTLLLNQLLLNLHNHDVSELTVEWLLRVEERLALWSRSWAAAKQTGGRIDLIVGILYDWGRIMLRSSTLDDERFTMSSMAILARASTQILTAYHEWYSTQSFNLMWQQLRHVITCAHITILCHVRFELLKEEAEANLVKVFWILALSEPRWTDQVQSARSKIEQMASVFGLVTPTQRAFDDELFAAMANEATQLNNGDYLSGMLFTDPVGEYGNALEPMKFDWFS